MPIFQEDPNVIGLQLRSILFVENSESDSVKAGQAFFGGNPHVSVLSLRDRVNGILGQAVFSKPKKTVELRKIAGGIKRQRNPATEAKQQEQTKNAGVQITMSRWAH